MDTQKTLRLTFQSLSEHRRKTTTAINVAGALADRGHEVLFVDLDAQGNGTIGLDLDEAYTDDELSLYDILIDLNEQQKIDAVIRSDEEFDVLPAHVEVRRSAWNADASRASCLR